ncbi:MAG: FtsW/RodA/SpoVE family cell cycle protein [Phycisphaerales bacterium]|nr:FtsW/RodA/SpoVE family cell cycle protein [Phycisphaerales bacterium]
MTQATAAPHIARRGYTPVSLHVQAREIHRSRLAFVNPAVVSIAAALALNILGLMAISTSSAEHAWRQVAFLLVGVVAAASLAIPSPRRVCSVAWPFYALTLLLLVFVLIPFVPEWLVRPRNGARRWINLGFTDFQPSEMAKLAFVLVLASWLRHRRNHRRLLGLMVPFALTLIPLALVLREPDLGTALLFVPALFAMLIAAGAKKRHIAAIVLGGLLVAPLSYPMLKPHQRARIDAMIAQMRGDDRYEQDIGFQGARAMTLVGAGGLAGVGREHAAALVEYNRLPEEHNDMIFAVICCRWGLWGGLLVWGLFLVFAAGGLLAAALSKNPFARLVAVGVVAITLTQMVINTGMTIGLLPITGMTLPFVSYGGSSLIVSWMMTGLLLGIGLRRPRYLTADSFEFDENDEPIR